MEPVTISRHLGNGYNASNGATARRVYNGAGRWLGWRIKDADGKVVTTIAPATGVEAVWGTLKGLGH